MNLVAIAQFFEALYTSIFKYFLIARFIKSRLLGPISTYFKIIEINSSGILYLHFFL